MYCLLLDIQFVKKNRIIMLVLISITFIRLQDSTHEALCRQLHFAKST